MSECLGRLLQPYSADLSAIAALVGTGYARKTGIGAWALDATIPASRGGTGQMTYAEGDLLYGNAGTTLSKLAIQPLPGYVLSSGSAPTWQQLSTLTATTITGTANQVLVNGTSGSGQTGPVTLTLPQNIHTGATPTFSKLSTTFGAEGLVSIQPSAIGYASVEAWSGNGPDQKAILFSSPGGSGAIGVGSLTNHRVDFYANNSPVGGFTTAGALTMASFTATAGAFAPATIYKSGTLGMVIAAAAGSLFDLLFLDPSGNVLMTYPAGSNEFQTTGAIRTGSPSGGTSHPWKLGNYTAGAAAQAGKVRVEINGTPYDLLTA